jgi:hypothetical protein
MMPLFNVFVEGVVVVFAPDADAAIERALSADTAKDDLAVVSVSRIKSEAALCEQWEPEHRPYGLPHDDYRSIRGILRAENQE